VSFIVVLSVDFFHALHRHITLRLIKTVEVGRQLKRTEQQRFAHSLDVTGIMFHSRRYIENRGFGNRVLLILFSDKVLNLRIKGAYEVRQLRAQEEQVFVGIVVMRFQFQSVGLHEYLPAHVDLGAGEIAVASKICLRTGNYVRDYGVFSKPGTEKMVVLVASGPLRPWRRIFEKWRRSLLG
jgi:hypothetical protein